MSIKSLKTVRLLSFHWIDSLLFYNMTMLWLRIITFISFLVNRYYSLLSCLYCNIWADTYSNWNIRPGACSCSEADTCLAAPCFREAHVFWGGSRDYILLEPSMHSEGPKLNSTTSVNLFRMQRHTLLFKFKFIYARLSKGGEKFINIYLQ